MRRPLACARGFDQSHDRQAVVFPKRKRLRGHSGGDRREQLRTELGQAVLRPLQRFFPAIAKPRGANLATLEEVARAVEFLLSHGAAYINGVEIPASGGSVY